MILGSGLLLNSGMLRIWPSTLENTPVFGLMVAGRIIPFGGFEVAGAGVYIPAPEEASRGAIFESMVMLGWSGAVPLCWTSPNCSACRILGGHLGIYNLNVVRSIGRLLDHGSLSKPLPVVEDGDLIAIVRHMLHARGRDTVSVTKVKDKLLRLMLSKVGFAWRIGSVMMRLTLLLILVGGIWVKMLRR